MIVVEISTLVLASLGIVVPEASNIGGIAAGSLVTVSVAALLDAVGAVVVADREGLALGGILSNTTLLSTL